MKKVIVIRGQYNRNDSITFTVEIKQREGNGPIQPQTIEALAENEVTTEVFPATANETADDQKVKDYFSAKYADQKADEIWVKID